jgi:hypothetical protein
LQLDLGGSQAERKERLTESGRFDPSTMSITERDFILRAIRQIGDALSRMRGFRKSEQLDDAWDEAQRTTAAILGPSASMIERLDPSSAILLLGDPARVRAYGLVVAERSTLQAARGNEREARMDRIRALEILAAWMKATEAMDDDVLFALEQLRDGP